MENLPKINQTLLELTRTTKCRIFNSPKAQYDENLAKPPRKIILKNSDWESFKLHEESNRFLKYEAAFIVDLIYHAFLNF